MHFGARSYIISIEKKLNSRANAIYSVMFGDPDMYNTISAHYKDRSTAEDEDISEPSMAERVALQSALNDMHRNENFDESFEPWWSDSSMGDKYVSEWKSNIKKVVDRKRKFFEQNGFWLCQKLKEQK